MALRLSLAADSSFCCPFLPSRRHFVTDHKVGGRHRAKGVHQIHSASRREPDHRRRRRHNHDHEREWNGRLVDQGMIVLRKRIHHTKLMEPKRYHDSMPPPVNWMEWEKDFFYWGYNEFVYQAVSLIQTQLMNTRPCIALGYTALLALSLSTSTALIMLRIVEVARGVVSG